MRVFGVLALTLVVACGEKMNGRADARQPSVGESLSTDLQRSESVVGDHAVVDGPVVVFLGTSLTAGYGLSPDRAYPAVVARLAEEDDRPIRVVNAGLSGETSAGALRRVDWVLRNPADLYVIETGANDGLRALDANTTRANIAALIRKIRDAQPDAGILLVQMEAPPNFGREYTTRFRSIFPEIAAETGATLVPFLLEGVATVPELNQADGIHPNVVGAERVAANVWAYLRPAVESLSLKAPR